MKATEAELNKLCASTVEFWPKSVGQFICPGCLGIFPRNSDQISVEHIIPQAAKGKLETFLCKTKCNNRFGSTSADWLGSYLIHTVEALEMLRPKNRRSNQKISLNGASLGGKVWSDSAGMNLQFLRDPPGSKIAKVNSPQELKKLDNSNQNQIRVTLTDQVELFRDKENYIKIGMLGAAYFFGSKVSDTLGHFSST